MEVVVSTPSPPMPIPNYNDNYIRLVHCRELKYAIPILILHVSVFRSIFNIVTRALVPSAPIVQWSNMHRRSTGTDKIEYKDLNNSNNI